MSIVERLRRVPTAGWTLLFAVALILPGLGAFGFWDPWELSIADQARDVARSGQLFDPTVKGRYAAQPPLELALSALGMKMIAVSEFGARFFQALLAIVAIAAVYWAGLGLFRRRAALLGALALGTMPFFFLQARQLTSDMPLVAGLALSMGGFGRYAWPASGRRRWRDLGVGLLGVVIGLLGGGALLGVAIPCLALAGALLVGWTLAPRAKGAEPVSALTAAGSGPDVPEDRTLGAGLLSRGSRGLFGLGFVVLLGVATLVLTLTTANIAGKYSLWLGGIPRGGTPALKFEYLIRQLGFGIFPWSALAVFALGRPLARLADPEPEGGRLAFGQVYLLIFASFAFVLTTVFAFMTGEARYPALAAIALAIGSFLDEALEGRRSEPVLGLLIATGTMVVARDFFLAPEELASVHLFQKVKWPPTMTIGHLFMGVGAIVGVGVYTGLATRGRALGTVALRDLGSDARPWRHRLERLVVELGRWGIQAAVAAAVVFALVVAHVIVPRLSRHFSFKPVLESYARFAKSGEAIGKYRVEGQGLAFYSERELVDIPTHERLVAFLQQPARAFSLVPVDELAALDAAFKTAGVSYFVVDSSSSRFLLLSNRIGAGEEDHNPLKANVWMAPRPPVRAAAGYDWQGQKPPWSWRLPVAATFGDAIELVGADFPTKVSRPAKVPVTLYFRVNARPPGAYKLFVHLDTPSEPRLTGDHHPVGGTFPTSYWLPGEYIRDEYPVEVPRMTTTAGTYTLYVGFWPGGEAKRLPITSGPNDGSDRVRLGTIEVR